MWEWILEVLDNSRRNIKLDQAKFDMNSLSRDHAFNVQLWELEKTLTIGWVSWLKHGLKDGPLLANWKCPMWGLKNMNTFPPAF